jgi:hypothetical protein
VTFFSAWRHGGSSHGILVYVQTGYFDASSLLSCGARTYLRRGKETRAWSWPLFIVQMLEWLQVCLHCTALLSRTLRRPLRKVNVTAMHGHDPEDHQRHCVDSSYRYTISYPKFWKAPNTESFFMEVVCTSTLAFGPNMPRRDKLWTHSTQVCCVQTLETRRGVALSWLRQSCLSASTSVSQHGVMCFTACICTGV